MFASELRKYVQHDLFLRVIIRRAQTNPTGKIRGESQKAVQIDCITTTEQARYYRKNSRRPRISQDIKATYRADSPAKTKQRINATQSSIPWEQKPKTGRFYYDQNTFTDRLQIEAWQRSVLSPKMAAAARRTHQHYTEELNEVYTRLNPI